jgi:hypothetical protein
MKKESLFGLFENKKKSGLWKPNIDDGDKWKSEFHAEDPKQLKAVGNAIINKLRSHNKAGTLTPAGKKHLAFAEKEGPNSQFLEWHPSFAKTSSVDLSVLTSFNPKENEERGLEKTASIDEASDAFVEDITGKTKVFRKLAKLVKKNKK